MMDILERARQCGASQYDGITNINFHTKRQLEAFEESIRADERKNGAAHKQLLRIHQLIGHGTATVPPPDGTESYTVEAVKILVQRMNDYQSKSIQLLQRLNLTTDEFIGLQDVNVELDRRLAEHQAFIFELQELAQWMTGCGFDFAGNKFFADNRTRLLAKLPTGEELTKLLSEAEQRGYQQGYDAKQLEVSKLELVGVISSSVFGSVNWIESLGKLPIGTKLYIQPPAPTTNKGE
jgi:hypothetical protein